MLNFSTASIFKALKIGENVVCVSNCLELLGVSSGSNSFAYDTLFVLGGLRVKVLLAYVYELNNST